MTKNKKRILVIDDDTDICFLLKGFLEQNQYVVDTAYSGNTGLKLLDKGAFDVVLCDFRLPDYEGLDLLKTILALNARLRVIMITGYSDVKIAVQAMKMGAYEYVTKPIYPEEILMTIEQCLKAETEQKSGSSAQGKSVKKNTEFTYVEGKSAQSQQLQKLIDLVAPTSMTCLVMGESGTGKEYVARKLHLKSERKEGPFVAVDCGALSNDIASSELFGHVKGAFTGAHQNKTGHFEMAEGGTLFLDEVGNLSYENQVKLLRVLQERKVMRVGDNKNQKVDIRLIAATNDDLGKSVHSGEFREDLYHRINEFKIEILPLRQRKDDIGQFARYFLEKANNQLGKAVEGIEPKASAFLAEHSWPGNLRELQNVIKRAVLMEQTNMLQIESLPSELGSVLGHNPMSTSFTSQNGIIDLKTAVEETEKRVIAEALKQTQYNKSKAAELLKIDRKTLYNKMGQYGLKEPVYEESSTFTT